MSYYQEHMNQISISSSDSNNKYVYFKQNFIPNTTVPVPAMCNKVLVNPHFNKKVFVNPNYKPNSAPSRTIHINPNVTSMNFSGDNTNRTTSSIHVNPKVLNTGKEKPLQRITYFSKTKLIRSPVKSQTIQESKKVRSIFSKFKVVKSPQGKVVLNTKYKLRRLSSNKLKKVQKTKLSSRFKVDNRINNKPSSKSKFVFVNRFVSISDIAKNVPLKRNRKLNLVNISGIIYKKSPNHLQRVTKKEKKRSSTLNQNKEINRTRFKIVRTQIKPENRKLVKNILSRYSLQKNNSTGRLKKCNIPCPYFRKFGKCKGNDMGKCPRKHDPNQIALCTKFLQGACINSKCLLSHNVSPEKMPTCKFYLEGSCSKDNCPYLHVKISPKADVCRDFLEGFCKKASECDKRHQFLCPDFEKKGECVKARCPYPHGRMVRKYYSDFNKEKFAKKSSKTEKEEIIATARYYSDQNIESTNINTDKLGNFRLRPKLGELPSFISLEEK